MGRLLEAYVMCFVLAPTERESHIKSENRYVWSAITDFNSGIIVTSEGICCNF